jgi:hypothetical protein
MLKLTRKSPPEKDQMQRKVAELGNKTNFSSARLVFHKHLGPELDATKIVWHLLLLSPLLVHSLKDIYFCITAKRNK